MKLFETKELVQFSSDGYIRQVLEDMPGYKTILICFQPGQRVKPCVMQSHTLFYVLEGT